MATRRLEGRTVLIVDDDAEVLSSFDFAMRAEGARTETVQDGNAAIAAYRAGHHDALVLDMMLPRRSGFLVLEQLQQEDDPPAVVMVTANQGRRHMAYAESLGVHAYLTKPVPLERLIETVARICREHEEARASD
jgi:DNA-binding response OmpR family regulator